MTPEEHKKQILEGYEALRKRQQAEGTYNPYRNGNPVYEDQHINNAATLRIDERYQETMQRMINGEIPLPHPWRKE